MEKNENHEASPASGHEKIFFSWQIPEYEKHDRGRNWHIAAFGISLLLLLFSLATLNFLFALIIAISAFVIIMNHGQEPPLLEVVISESGLRIGNRFYDYDEIKNFAIVYKPQQGVKQLYLEFKSWYRHRLSLPLLDINPVLLRRALLEFLDEDKEREEPPLTESLARLLKL